MSTEQKTLEYLLDFRVVKDLKKLVRLVVIDVKLPTRKVEIIAHIVYEFKNHLRHYWNALDDLQQKAVAEALYAPWFDAGGFYSKYGELPDWGESAQWSPRSIVAPSLLNLFILGENQYGFESSQKVVPDDLKVRHGSKKGQKG